MTAHKLVLSAVATGPLADLMSSHPGVRLEGTPMGHLLLLRCSGGQEVIDGIGAALDPQFVAHPDKDGDRLTLVAEVPGPEAALFARLNSADALLLPPLVWQDGRVRVRLLTFGAMNGEVVRSLLPGGTLESKAVLRSGEVERELLGSGLLLPALTKRQGESVLAALDAGYYDAPRKVTTEDIARRLGLARSTFEEHLKAAESQIVRALAPVVRLRLLEKESDEGAGAEALRVYAGFSEDLGLYVNLTLRNERVAAVSLSSEPLPGSKGDEHPYLARILEHLATGTDDMRDIPLDLRVTAFEREVLDTLRTVPPGEVVTYGQLAAMLGRPRASRAVGHACAINPAVVLVPCHRVVPAAGGLGNYSAVGGPGTKRKLLEKEGALKMVRKKDMVDR